MRKRSLLTAALAVCALTALSAQGSAPRVQARSVCLIEAARGDTLLERGADLPIPPASLAKLATLAVLGEDLDLGRVSLDEVVEILPGEAWDELPFNASSMYLERGMRVSIRDLARGLAVASANDAAFVLARRLSGSVSAFAVRMNRVARRYGLSKTRFDEPSGLSDRSVTTAREMARFALSYLRERQDFLADFHSLPSMDFPLPAHFAPGRRLPPAYTPPHIENRNPLLGAYPGCDGLKTGYIAESGFNLVATAERSGTRFILVILGAAGASNQEAQALRLKDGGALLDWAFANYATVHPAVPETAATRVWMGSESRVEAVPAGSLAITLRKSLVGNLKVLAEPVPEIMGPLLKGAKLGVVKLISGDEVLARVDLVAPRSIPAGSFWRRLLDSIGLFLRRLFSGAPEPSRAALVRRS